MSPRARAWLPLAGRLVLVGVWALVVSAKAVNPILLPAPASR
jgi:ABC-type nitrate/sulfonate/bicarbonate transport system permease component